MIPENSLAAIVPTEDEIADYSGRPAFAEAFPWLVCRLRFGSEG
jgi:hypothetical protein